MIPFLVKLEKGPLWFRQF